MFACSHFIIMPVTFITTTLIYFYHTFTDRPTATIRSLSPCITSFNISWDASNSITCGVVFYDVSISPPPTEGNPVATTVDRFYSVTRLNNSLRSVTLTARNRAGQTEITRDVQLLVPRGKCCMHNCTSKTFFFRLL